MKRKLKFNNFFYGIVDTGGGSTQIDLPPPPVATAKVDDNDGLGEPPEEVIADDQSQQDDSAAEPVAKAPVTPPSYNITPEALAEALTKAGVGAQPVPRQEAKPPTPEEIASLKKRLGFFEPTDEFLTRFDNLETRKQALAEFRDGQVNYVLGVVQMMLEKERGDWDEKLTPFQQERQEREEAKLVDGFNKKYSQLAKTEFVPIRKAVETALRQSGKAFASAEQVFDAVANGMAAVLKGLPGNENFTLSAGSNPAKPNGNPNAIKAAPRSGGGAGGGNANGGGNATGRSSLSTLLPAIVPKRK